MEMNMPVQTGAEPVNGAHGTDVQGCFAYMRRVWHEG